MGILSLLYMPLLQITKKKLKKENQTKKIKKIKIETNQKTKSVPCMIKEKPPKRKIGN